MSSKENTLPQFGKARKGELIYIKKKKSYVTLGIYNE